jgi:hypothetical protein
MQIHRGAKAWGTRLLTNRTWPNRASQAIRQVRPLVHDGLVEALEESPGG